MTTGARLAAQSSFHADNVTMRGLSARRTPPKSSTPTVDDLYYNGVSGQEVIKPKPATPFLQSNPNFEISKGKSCIGAAEVGDGSAVASPPDVEKSSSEL